MKLINKEDPQKISGGFAAIYSIDRETGVITYSDCFNFPTTITPDHPDYQRHYVLLGDKDIVAF